MRTAEAHPLERFWSLLVEGDVREASALLDPEGRWDDPLFDAAEGPLAHATAIPRLAAWLADKRTDRAPMHLATTADDRRVVVEDVLTLKDGMIWNQAEQRSERVPSFELATAVVGDLSAGGGAPYRSLRVYFSTWAALSGASRVRKGPICPDERARTKAAMDAMPTIRSYFERLEAGDATMIELFEPDGYFREPANNFACGRDQLAAHFQHILKLGGVGIEFLTATRQGDRIGVELQTAVWGKKRMPEPQAGFACYELGVHGKIRGSRVYDSVVPPDL